jgi:transposase
MSFKAQRLRGVPLVAAFEEWMRAERVKLSAQRRWPACSSLLDDGRICLTNNAAERTPRGPALGRKSWLFAGSER